MSGKKPLDIDEKLNLIIKQNKNTLLSYICQDSNGNLPLNNDSSSTYINYAQILKSYNPSGNNS